MSASKVRIGIVSLSSGHLGDAVRVERFGQALRQMGFEVVTLNPYARLLPMSPGKRDGNARLTTFIPRAWRMLSRLPGMKSYPVERLAYGTLPFALSRILYRQARKERLNLLQAETWLAGDVALPVKEALGLPMILDIHSGSFVEEIKRTVNPSPRFLEYWAEKEKRLLARSDHIIVTSQGMKEHLESGYGLKNVSLAPNGADPWHDGRAAHSLPLKVIYAGIFAYWERVHDFLDAARLLGNRDFQFYLAGDGYQKGELLRKIAQEHIPVSYLGSLPHREVRRHLADMHIGVAPRANHHSMRLYSSLKTYEYLSLGLPVVCADAGEWADAVRQADCGLVVPAEDPVALAEAVAAYRDQLLWQRHSANAMQLIEQRCSWEKIIGGLAPIYTKYEPA